MTQRTRSRCPDSEMNHAGPPSWLSRQIAAVRSRLGSFVRHERIIPLIFRDSGVRRTVSVKCRGTPSHQQTDRVRLSTTPSTWLQKLQARYAVVCEIAIGAVA